MSDAISLMRRGALTEVLHVQNPVATPTSGGSSTTVYQPVEPGKAGHSAAAWDAAIIPAEVEPLRGEEHLQARQVVGATSYRVRTDLDLPDGVTLTSRSRLVWASVSPNRTLEVAEPPRPSNVRQQLVFLVTERESA